MADSRVDLAISSPTNNAVIQGPSLTVSGLAQAWIWIPADQTHEPREVEVTISITDASPVTIPGVQGHFVSPPFVSPRLD